MSFVERSAVAPFFVIHRPIDLVAGGKWVVHPTGDDHRRGPAVSMGTWMPAARGRKPRPAQVGVEHGTGPKALDRLAEVGVELPQGWFKRQDHAKNGIVAELPDGVDLSTVVSWLVTVATELRTVVYPGDEWVAIVHEPA